MSWLNKGFFIGKKGVEKRILSGKTLILRAVTILAILAALLMLTLALGKNKLIFFPVKGLERNLAGIGWEFEDVWLTGSDGGKVNAWYLPGPPEAAVALLLHGNGGNLELMIGRAIMYHKLGFGVMAVDYEGYGLSEGSPSEEAAYFDAQASWDFLISRGVKPDRILIHGFSLGGGVASWLAYQNRRHRNPIVLDSTFTNIEDVAGESTPWLKPILSLIIGGDFDTYERLKSINSSQLLVLHSPDDGLVPFKLGEKNYLDYDGGPKEFVTLTGGHMDFLTNLPSYSAAIKRLYGDWAQAPPEMQEGRRQ
jgi:pimeloyl-ACP methyl ester carboxylesterase